VAGRPEVCAGSASERGAGVRRPKSFPCILLPPLCAPFPSAALYFQSSAASFRKTPGWGVPQRIFYCTKGQKRPSVSPLLATLTHSCSRKSFVCHSYENTRDGGSLRTSRSPFAPPPHARRNASIPCALSRLRILPVATGVCPLRSFVLTARGKSRASRLLAAAHRCRHR
jgi:hypothetical protein